MAFVKVASAADLEPGTMREVTVNGNCYALCNAGGDIHAISGVCLHRGGPLADGALHGTSVVCPWHAWEWDCRTGASDFNPDLKLATCPVKIEDGEIWIDAA
jgi:nitrite reductase (NADH) small subunit